MKKKTIILSIVLGAVVLISCSVGTQILNSIYETVLEVEKTDASSSNSGTQNEIVQKEDEVSDPKTKIESLLQNLCKDINSMERSLHDGKYLSKGFAELLKKAKTLESEKELYGEFLETDYWLEAQDNGDVSLNSLEFVSIDEKSACVKVQFKDSDFGVKKIKTLYFILENNEWCVDDMSIYDMKSLRKYTEDFIKNN